MANIKTDKPLWLLLAPAAFILLWAGGYGVAKVALQYAEPLTLLSLRFGCVVLILSPVCLVLKLKGKPPALPAKRIDWMHLVVVGVLVQAVYFGFCWWAFKTGVSAGVLAIFMSLQPILIAIVAPKLAQENISKLRWLGLILSLAGVLVVILARLDIEVPSIAGLLYSTLALLGISLGVLYEKRFGRSYHPVVSNMVQYAAGFAVVLPMAWWFETMHIQWTWELLIALIYLVGGNSIIAISLLLAMIRVGEVSRVSSLMFLVPPLAALFGWILLGEEMPPLAWAGMALAALGVVLATRETKNTAS